MGLEPTLSILDGAVKCVSRYGRTTETILRVCSPTKGIAGIGSERSIVFPEGAGGTDQVYYVVVFSEGATQGEAKGTIQDVSLAAYRALAPSDAR